MTDEVGTASGSDAATDAMSAAAGDDRAGTDATGEGPRSRSRRPPRRRPRRPRKPAAPGEATAAPATAEEPSGPAGAAAPTFAAASSAGDAEDAQGEPVASGRSRPRGRSRGRGGGRGRKRPAAGAAEGAAAAEGEPGRENLLPGEWASPATIQELEAVSALEETAPPEELAGDDLDGIEDVYGFLAAEPIGSAEPPGQDFPSLDVWALDEDHQPLPEAEPPSPVQFLLEEVSLEQLQSDAAETGAGTRRRGRGGKGRAPRAPRISGTLREPRQADKAPEERAGEPRAAEDRPARETRAAEPRQPRERAVHKEILVNVGERETRIAVIEDGRLVELHVEREERVVGSIYKGRVANVLAGMDAAFVDVGLERNAFLYVGDILFEAGGEGSAGTARRTSRDVRIKDIARPGQDLLLQVVKGPRGTKGARVSTRISLPGRFLVLMPEGDHLGVSRKVEESAERERLRRIGEAIRPAGFGLIIRTEAEEKSEEELRQDLDMLVQLWRQVSEKARRGHAPSLVHQDLSLILKTIRDVFGSDVDKMIVDSESEYQKAVEMLEVLSPSLRSRVHLHAGPAPLFDRYNVEEEIERLLRRKVWLRSGGYLTIDQTEALTTIDVNTGKYIGTTSLSDTILKTNLDAVGEIARQLRLRDIGGMIIIDFIDMSTSRDRQQVMRALEAAFRKDRTRTKIAHISPLGLVEMTRKRTGEAVTDVMTESCPYCQGRGRVWSPETMAIQIEREIRSKCAQQDFDALLVHANPEVALWLIGPEGENVEQLERQVRRPIYIRARQEYHIERYEIHPGEMLEIEKDLMPYRGGHVVECQVTRMDLIAPPRSAAWADGYFVDLANGSRYDGQATRVRLVDVRRSFALGEPVPPHGSIDRSEPI